MQRDYRSSKDHLIISKIVLFDVPHKKAGRHRFLEGFRTFNKLGQLCTRAFFVAATSAPQTLK
jgi:hypothetical protein